MERGGDEGGSGGDKSDGGRVFGDGLLLGDDNFDLPYCLP